MKVETIEEELERRFRRHPFVIEDNGCWRWTGPTNHDGYGRITTKNDQGIFRVNKAHRVAYLLRHGPFDESMAVCHSCDNPPCVNPKHLFLGTKKENWDDMRAKERNPRGSRHPHAKLDEAKVREIKSLLADGKTIGHCSRVYGVERTTISSIKRGKTWRHVS